MKKCEVKMLKDIGYGRREYHESYLGDSDLEAFTHALWFRDEFQQRNKLPLSNVINTIVWENG